MHKKKTPKKSLPKKYKQKEIDYAPTKIGFKFTDKIGEGSYGLILACEFESEKYACKYLDTSNMDQKMIDKFLPRELHFHTILLHPNIVSTLGIIKNNLIYYIFMEAAETDLLCYIQENAYLHEIETKKYFYQIVSGIKYMHSMMAAHRDLKLENIYLTANKRIKIGDFGYAKYVNEEEDDTEIVLSKTFCGSRAYVAPEILRGVPYNALKSDIFALGVILSALLNGLMPFVSDSKNLIESINNQEIAFNNEVDLSLESVQLIYNCVHPDAKTRLDIYQVYESAWLKDEVLKRKEKVLHEKFYSIME